MDDRWLDQAAKALAVGAVPGGLPRRAILRGGGAGLAAALLAPFGLRSSGWAQDSSPVAEGTPAEQAISWISAGQAGDVPSQRSAARMTQVGDELVLFGGLDECFDVATGCEHVYYNDVHHFDLASQRWRRVDPATPDGTLPAERAFHSQAG